MLPSETWRDAEDHTVRRLEGHVMTLPSDPAERYKRAAALVVEAEALMTQLEELVPETQHHVATAEGAASTPNLPEDDIVRREALDALEDATTRRDRARALSDRLAQLRAEIEALLEA